MKAWHLACLAGAVGVGFRLFVFGAASEPAQRAERRPTDATPAGATTACVVWPSSARPATAPSSLGGGSPVQALPVQFVENCGQVSGPARFVVGWPHAPAWITPTGLMLEVARCDPPRSDRRRRLEDDERRAATPVHGAHVALSFEGASADSIVESVEPASTLYSYFLGDDPSRWVRGIPGSRRLRWTRLYPGISVELHGETGRLEYDIRLEPGADLSQFVVRVEGADGLSLLPDGSLRIDTAGGAIVQAPPPTWTETANGGRQPVACAYTLLDQQHFGFVTEERATARRLVIDPELQFGTFLGGSGSDVCSCVAVDAWGNACLGGNTTSGTDFPVTPGAFDAIIGTIKPDGFVAKLSPSGDSLIHATYLGGGASVDSVTRIDMAANGDLVVSGGTGSSDFPTTSGAFDGTLDGDTDSFITRLTANGSSLIYSTLIGGNDDDAIRGLALDSQERACFAGQTRSPDFPVTPNAFQPTINPVFLDGMLGRLSADGSALDYSTFMPGAHNTQCLTLDLEGRVYVGGGADGFYVPTPGAFQTPFGEEFVYKFDFDLGLLVYAAKFGGWNISFTEGLAVDARGAVYVCGNTDSFNFPTTAGAFNTTINGFDDAFLVKLSPDGSELEWGTFFGGASSEAQVTVAIDGQNRICISGRTFSPNLPVTPDAFSSQLSRGDGAFLAQFSADGSQLLYSTYFGGTTFWEIPEGVAIDALDDVYVVGYTHAPDFPTTPESLMPAYGSGTANNGFVLKFAFGPWTNLGHALPGTNGATPLLLGEGNLEPGSPGSIALSQGKPLAPAYLLAGLVALNAPFKGGAMVPTPQLVLPLATDASGSRVLSWTHWPVGLPAGTELLMQYWIIDSGGPAGFSASNGLSAVMP